MSLHVLISLRVEVIRLRQRLIRQLQIHFQDRRRPAMHHRDLHRHRRSLHNLRRIASPTPTIVVMVQLCLLLLLPQSTGPLPLKALSMDELQVPRQRSDQLSKTDQPLQAEVTNNSLTPTAITQPRLEVSQAVHHHRHRLWQQQRWLLESATTADPAPTSDTESGKMRLLLMRPSLRQATRNGCVWMIIICHAVLAPHHALHQTFAERLRKSLSPVASRLRNSSVMPPRLPMPRHIILLMLHTTLMLCRHSTELLSELVSERYPLHLQALPTPLTH